MRAAGGITTAVGKVRIKVGASRNTVLSCLLQFCIQNGIEFTVVQCAEGKPVQKVENQHFETVLTPPQIMRKPVVLILFFLKRSRSRIDRRSSSGQARLHQVFVFIHPGLKSLKLNVNLVGASFIPLSGYAVRKSLHQPISFEYMEK